MKKILSVDDEPAILRCLEKLLGGRGYQVSTTTNPLEVGALVAGNRPDLLILDVMMPEMNGIALFAEMKKLDRVMPVLFVTAYHDSFNLSSDHILTLWHDYFGDGNVDILYKPFKEADLLGKVEMLIGPA